jgi:hypothetical protein
MSKDFLTTKPEDHRAMVFIIIYLFSVIGLGIVGSYFDDLSGLPIMIGSIQIPFIWFAYTIFDRKLKSSPIFIGRLWVLPIAFTVVALILYIPITAIILNAVSLALK